MEKYNGSFSFYYISAYLQKDAFWRNEKKNLEFEIQSRKMLNYMSNGYSYASRKCNKAYESFVLGDGQQILSLSLSLSLPFSLCRISTKTYFHYFAWNNHSEKHSKSSR